MREEEEEEGCGVDNGVDDEGSDDDVEDDDCGSNGGNK